MLAVADGRPETLGLKQIIRASCGFPCLMLTTRKYKTLLAKEQDKKEIQEGLIKACDVIDLIIEILRGSKNREQVKKLSGGWCDRRNPFQDQNQRKGSLKAQIHREVRQRAILEMRLYKLIGLEIEALQAEYQETMRNIARIPGYPEQL